MEKLGIQPVQLFTQVINFLVMVIILAKFLYKPILKALDERRKKIEAGLRYAEETKAELEKSEKRRKDIVAEAKDEARHIIDEAKQSGKKLEAEIVEKAHKEAEQIIAKGKSEVELERSEMEKELRAGTISVASAMVESVLRGALDAKTQHAIIGKKLQALARVSK
ncbi:F0F1 ATP synthase subunit B [Patescibacteria group bacterium]|nr:F0F1 ATP synthase subunit B [Patescibacteria group bacterium]